MRQKIAQYVLAHKPQIAMIERAALIGALAGATDVATRGLSGETAAVAIGFAILRACVPVVDGWLAKQAAS